MGPLMSKKQMIENSFQLIDELPEELVFYVFQFLGAKDLIKISLVCRYTHSIANDNFIWRNLFVRKFTHLIHVPVPPPSLRTWKHYYLHRVNWTNKWYKKNSRILFQIRYEGGSNRAKFTSHDEFATANWDGTIKLWSISKKKCLCTLPIEYIGPAWSICVSSNRTQIIGAAKNNDIHIYNLPKPNNRGNLFSSIKKSPIFQKKPKKKEKKQMIESGMSSIRRYLHFRRSIELSQEDQQTINTNINNPNLNNSNNLSYLNQSKNINLENSNQEINLEKSTPNPNPNPNSNSIQKIKKTRSKIKEREIEKEKYEIKKKNQIENQNQNQNQNQNENENENQIQNEKEIENQIQNSNPKEIIKENKIENENENENKFINEFINENEKEKTKNSQKINYDLLSEKFEKEKEITEEETEKQKILEPIVLRGHEGNISCVKFNSEILISGSSDSTARIWDLEKYECKSVLHHQNAVWALDFLGEHLLTGCKDTAVWWWNTSREEVVELLFGHKGPISTLQYQKSLVISGSYDSTCRVWDLRSSNRCVGKLKGHTGPVSCLQFDDNIVVTGSFDSTVKFWDRRKLSAGAVLTLKENDSKTWILSMEYLDGKILLSSNMGEVKILDFRTKEMLEVEESELISKWTKMSSDELYFWW
ncbi:f-box/wd repeat-containing protein pof1 [Anaeramoeba ignava]|uniref:F-box/wd repeat-containing protein pof1 n=1 Tax=Anaeramoeba ignava TaxID=1746090 RepID=A0A9Q0RF85_ANAIG|nr:f-box/wd repeat-containing protein pof1 [Anaeramoeba ignava]